MKRWTTWETRSSREISLIIVQYCSLYKTHENYICIKYSIRFWSKREHNGQGSRDKYKIAIYIWVAWKKKKCKWVMCHTCHKVFAILWDMHAIDGTRLRSLKLSEGRFTLKHVPVGNLRDKMYTMHRKSKWRWRLHIYTLKFFCLLLRIDRLAMQLWDQVKTSLCFCAIFIQHYIQYTLYHFLFW